MDWLFLLVAGLLEIAWAFGLKYSMEARRFDAMAVTVVAMVVSFWFLALAMRTIPLGTAYAVWTGIGVMGTTVLGMAFFAEPRDAPRLICLALVFSGVVGLRLL